MYNIHEFHFDLFNFILEFSGLLPPPPPSRCGFDIALKMYLNDGCVVGFVVMFQRSVLHQSSM